MILSQNSKQHNTGAAKRYSYTLYDGVGCNMKPLASQEGDYRYGFNGQEKDDEIAGKGNSYTAEFWQYDPRSARRWNVDPVYKHHFSNYSVMSGNPILRIDPDGANDTEFGVNEKGEVEQIGPTDDDPDKLFALNEDGTKNENITPATINDKTLLPQLSQTNEDYKGRYSIGEEMEESGKLFLFLSDNTNVELSFKGYKKNEENSYVVATSHSLDKVVGVKLKNFTELDLKISIHSHPDPDGTKGASHAYGTGDGDYPNVIRFKHRWDKAGKTPNDFPKHGVYHKETKTMYWYSPWNPSIKGATLNRN